MSTYFLENNLGLLELHHPDLAERISRAEDDHRYILEPSEEKGRPNLLDQGGSPPLAFYHPRRPGAHVRSGLESFKKRRSTLVVLMGVGLGYHALELVKEESLVRLNPSIFRTLMNAVDFSSVLSDERVRILAGCPEDGLFVALSSALAPHFAGLKCLTFLPLAAALQAAGPYYETCRKTLKEIGDTFIIGHAGNDPYDSLAAYEHFIANIEPCLTRPGGRYLKGLFPKRPAIVVATGPSLRKSIHLLKDLEDKAVIVSADASLRILHSHGIHPHVTATTERTPGFDKWFIGLKDLDKTVLAAVSFTHPSTLEAYNGPVVFFQRHYAFTSSLGFLEDAIDMGPSTANMAYAVARNMGCDPIILVGNDLAFDEDGSTHSPGFLYGQKQPIYDDLERIQAPGNYAPRVTTCQMWLNCLKHYEKSIAGWDGTLINATAGGARIPGSVVMPLSEALTTYCRDDFYPRTTLLGFISAWEAPSGRPGPMREALRENLDSLDQFIHRFKRMRSALQAILDDIYNETASGRISAPQERRLRESIPLISEALNALLNSSLYSVFNEFYVSLVLPLLLEWQVTSHRFSSTAWEYAYRVKLAHEFFGKVGQVSISLRHVLCEGQKALAGLDPEP